MKILREHEIVGFAKRDVETLYELEFTLDENGEWYSEEIQLNALGQNFLNAYLRSTAKKM